MTDMLRVRATLNYGNGGPGLYTSYWRPGTTGGVTADATDVAGRVRGFFIGIAGQLPNSTTVVVNPQVDVIEDIAGALRGSLQATPPAVVTGTGGATIGALAAMALARLRSGTVLGGRAVKGRWYLGPLASVAFSTSGGLAAASVTAINAAGAALLPAAATTSHLGIWHRPQGGTGGALVDCDAISTWDQIAVMRSRRDA